VEQWQRDVQKVMNVYVERTTGSFVFAAPSSISFNFLLADPELGDHQSKSLGLQLESVIADQVGLFMILLLGVVRYGC
jgi:trehalose-6-phosphatase